MINSQFLAQRETSLSEGKVVPTGPKMAEQWGTGGGQIYDGRSEPRRPRLLEWSSTSSCIQPDSDVQIDGTRRKEHEPRSDHLHIEVPLPLRAQRKFNVGH